METQTQSLMAQSNQSVNQKKELIYNLIVLQISNLIADIRVVFPRDIIYKVIQDNLVCLKENKYEAIDYLKNNISGEIKTLIINRQDSLFDSDNKSLKNIRFKRSEFVFSKIRKSWEKLDNPQKVVIWKYLNFIIKLLDKV